MKLIIFAGGSGKRFWPISSIRKPKQFINVIDDTSTFKMMIKRVQPVYGWNNIFVSTNERYVSEVKNQVPKIPLANIFPEPANRDLGAAVGLTLIRLRKMGVTEPIAFLWADHLVKKVSAFQKTFKKAEQLILQKKTKVVLVGETPTFANNNFGWIDVGKKVEPGMYEFKGFVYRPDVGKCKQMYKSKRSLWNTGYFISTVEYLLSLYEKYNPRIYNKLKKIEKDLDTGAEAATISKIYPTIEQIHSDHAIQYHIKPKDSKVLKSNFGWFDPGTLYALKKYLEPKMKNAVKGNVYPFKTKDCLMYNYEKDKLMAGVYLDGMVIVNTKDALLIVHKDHVRELSEMLRTFGKKGLEKYL